MTGTGERFALRPNETAEDDDEDEEDWSVTLNKV
jgi:hypothetical protein